MSWDNTEVIALIWTLHSSLISPISWWLTALSRFYTECKLKSGQMFKNMLKSYIDCQKVLVSQIHNLKRGKFAKTAINKT